MRNDPHGPMGTHNDQPLPPGPLTAEKLAGQSDWALSLKLRTLTARPDFFTEEERQALLMEVISRLERKR